jgi:hypothetical protein
MRALALALLVTAVEAGGTFSLGGAAADYAGDIGVDARGNLYVVGGFSRTVDFDPGEGEEKRTSAGRADAFVAKYDGDGKLQWVVTYGSKDMDFARCVAFGPRDGRNAVYVAGHYSGKIDLGPGGTLETKAGRNVVLLKLRASDGEIEWARSFGDEDPHVEWSEDARDIAVDKDGNVHVVGIFRGTIDLDPGDGKNEHESAADSTDGYVVSLAPDGSHRWGFGLGGDDIDHLRAVAVSPDGLVLLAGCFSETVDFDPGEKTAAATSEGRLDAFVAWYGPDGRFEYLVTWGGYGIDQVSDRALAVAADGAVYAAGEFKGKCDFAPGRRKFVQASDGVDAFVVRLDRGAGLEWVYRIGAGGSDAAHGLCLQENGTVVVTGRFQKRVDFAPGRSKCILGAKGSAGATHAFVAAYDPKGRLRWARSLGDKVSGVVKLTRGNAVAARPDGSSVLLGTYFGDLDVAPGKQRLVLPGAGSADLFLVRYDAKGSLVR